MATPPSYISIDNFTPGMFSDFHAGQNAIGNSQGGNPRSRQMLVNGAATVENTYGCIADAHGALGPLPSRIPTCHDYALPIAAMQVPDQKGWFVLDVGTTGRNAIATGTTTASDPLYGENPPGEYVYVTYCYFEQSQPTNMTMVLAGRSYQFDQVVALQARFHLLQECGPGVYNNVMPAVSYANLRYVAGELSSAPGVIPGSSNPRFYNNDFAWPATCVVAAVHRSTLVTASPRTVFNAESGASKRVWDETGKDSNEYLAPVAICYDPTSSVFTQTYRVGANAYTLNRAATAIVGMNVLNPVAGMQPGSPVYSRLWTWKVNDQSYASAITGKGIGTPYLSIAHQGRLVMLDDMPSILKQIGDSGLQQVHIDSTVIRYSDWGLPLQNKTPRVVGMTFHPAFDISSGSTPYNVLAVDGLNDSCGAMGSVSNDRLLVVMHRGGAVLISGDLDDPTIRTLPSVESTHGTRSHGTNSPIGFVYGSRLGVYAWQGGDQSIKLSRQLDGFFWDHTANASGTRPRYGGASGRFAYWNDLILTPNNYAYSITGDSWWRLEAPATDVYNVYLELSTGPLIAFPFNRISGAGLQPHAFGYRQDILRNSYSWQSQPLIETRGRTLTLQEVRILASATPATFKVTLTGFDVRGKPTSREVTLLSSAAKANGPVLLRKDLTPNLQAEYVTVRVEVTAAPGDAAPKLFSISVGVNDRARTVRAG